MSYYPAMALTQEQAIVAMAIGDLTNDARRLIVAGLINHDPETFDIGLQRASNIIGSEAAHKGTLLIITQLIEKGLFSF